MGNADFITVFILTAFFDMIFLALLFICNMATGKKLCTILLCAQYEFIFLQEEYMSDLSSFEE